MGVFDKRISVKPYEYPNVLNYMKAIRNSYWVVDEFNFEPDIQDFKIKLNKYERNVVKRAMIAISQIENNVKTFWGKLYEHCPKPEMSMVGYSFAECEVRHMEAYSELLGVLGLNKAFEESLEEPVLKGRVEYLEKYLRNAGDNAKQRYTLNLTLFGAFIERVSLFSQFALIKSFEKENNVLKEISNVIESTRSEEFIHYKFALELINIIKKEYPEFFDEHYNDVVKRACMKAFEAEKNIIDWMYEGGDLDLCPKNTLIEYIKFTFNSCLSDLGIEKIFDINDNLLKKLRWFINEEFAYNRNDFFASMSNNYNKFRQISPFKIALRLKKLKNEE